MSDPDELETILDDLSLLRDTCNVYVLKEGSRYLLVDFGSGAVLEYLAGGGKAIDWVLHTHHHRDQCQGDHLLPDSTGIAVPFHERPLFDAAEDFWRNKQIYDSYNNQSTYFTLTRSVRVKAVLSDYEVFSWEGHDFTVLPALGHTHGSICLLSEIGGRRVAFTGDLIHSSGKVWNLTELQHSYGGVEGVDLNAYSLRDLSRWSPDLILPSHGQPIAEPSEAIERTIGNLRSYHRYVSGQPLTIDKPLKRLLPHLLVAPHACCTFYVLLSDSGKAMLIDYGAASGNHFYAHLRQFESWELQRFVEHSIHELKENWGVRSIEVVMPTHYHDDHTCGIPHLQKHHAVKVWALEEMVNILENPREYSVPCLLPYPIRVDRSIRDGEVIDWEGYELKVVHFPGQTKYHMAMAVKIDGKRVAFTGDSLIDAGDRLVQPIIHRNIVTAEAHAKCARKLAELAPEFIAHGHGAWSKVDEGSIRTLAERAEQTKRLFEDLLPFPAAVGVNPSWVRIVPYQTHVERGGKVDLKVQIRNYFQRPIEAEAGLVLPDGWDHSTDRGQVHLEAGALGGIEFQVIVGDRVDRFGIAADIIIDGRPIGQIAEAIVRVGP